MAGISGLGGSLLQWINLGSQISAVTSQISTAANEVKTLKSQLKAGNLTAVQKFQLQARLQSKITGLVNVSSLNTGAWSAAIQQAADAAAVTQNAASSLTSYSPGQYQLNILAYLQAQGFNIPGT